MNYNNILELLLIEFPELEKEMLENDYLHDLPHCFFDIIFVPYISNACKEKKELLSKVGDFLEQMAICSDIKVKELLNVSVLEPLVLERNVTPVLCKYLKKETIGELQYWEERYNNR